MLNTNVSRTLLAGLVGCCLLATGTLAATAEPPAPAKPAAKAASKTAAPMSEDQMMAEMMKLATPGPNHEMLKKFAGSWKAVTKMWMGPGEPQVSEGTAEASMILGGRFLKQEFKGTFMGQPFEGFGLTGYDNKKKKFITVWGDLMGSGLLEVDGTYNAATKETTYKGVEDIVGPPVPFRMVSKMIDDNKYTFEWYEKREGKEVRTMEITYTRK